MSFQQNKISTLVFLFFMVFQIKAEALLLPYIFENNSEYADSNIHIALVGKFSAMGDVWMDMSTSQLIKMSSDDNAIAGPDWSTPAEWTYPEIFTKLSDLQNKTIQIPLGLYACRIFISFESPMYLRFHPTGGYAGANLNSTSDPNDGIRWEIVELTWGTSGLWTNTSRVDAYQYPMGLEVEGFSGQIGGSYEDAYNSAINGAGTPKNGKIGELLSHEKILAKWDQMVPTEYLVSKIVKPHSIDGGPIIEQPSKVSEFSKDVLDAYIDEIWNTYSTNNLTVNIGDRGTWVGRVTDGVFNFTDPADGSIATIYSKPNTVNAIEGSGSMAYTPVSAATNIEKYNEDLMIQAQIAAAISRHAIYTDQVGETVQYTHDATRFFKIKPYNEYVAFFHDSTISFKSQTYAFAYDDVGDHSSTIQCPFPTKVKVVIGGYAKKEDTVGNEDIAQLRLKNSGFYHNIINNTITIQNLKSTGASMQILNTMGQVVFNKKLLSDGEVIDLNSIGKGLYFIKIDGATKSLIKRN